MSTNVTPLVEDVVRPAGMFDPELTYYADGTHVVVRGAAPLNSTVRNGRTGVTQGRTAGSSPYPFQVVRWDDDGTTDNVAPHVLARVVGTGEYGGGECIYTFAGIDTDWTAFYHCHAHDADEVSPDAPCANAPHGPVKRGPAPLSTHPVAVLSARVIATRAMASRGNTLRPGAVLIPETPREARAEYVAARERGETVEQALSRARAELVAYRVLSPGDLASGVDSDPYALGSYDVDPGELARVTSDPRTATLAGEVRDAETGALILSPVTLPDGATARVYVYADDDADDDAAMDVTRWEGDGYDDDDREAWEENAWRFVGVTAVVTLADGARGEASLWGVEMGSYFPGSDAAQIWHTIPDLVREAAGEATDAEPDPENIPEDDRATCGTCHRSWNARTLPTPAARCPWEHEHRACPVCEAGIPGGDDEVNAHYDAAHRDDDSEPPAANLAARVRGIVDELDPEGTEHDENHDPDYAGGVGTCPACWGDRLREVLDAEAAR